MNFFDLSLKLNGFPIKKAQTLLKSIQNKNDKAFKGYTETKKQEIISYHLKHNQFYKGFAKHIDSKNWNTVPVMTKRDLQQPLANRLSKGFNNKNIHIHKTSGSSGDPFIFAKDKFCHALTWAVFIDRYNWFNLSLNHSKQARFYGIPLNKTGYYKERFKDLLGKRFRFSVFDLSDAQFEKNLKKFKSTKFDYINGYTSSIVQFAKFLEHQNLILNQLCPSLKACIITSEMLFKDHEILLKRHLGVPILNEYGAAELGLIAFPNTDGEWLLNNQDLFIEILDEQNNVLPYGEEGRIVITSLYNKAHPFIRYDLGDTGKLSISKKSKRPILEKLVGRTNDIVKLPSGKRAAGLTFYYVTKTIIEDQGYVKEFVIEQRKINTFKIIYVSSKTLNQEQKKRIKEAVFKYLEPNLIVLFEQRIKLDRSKNGKLRQFKSYL